MKKAFSLIELLVVIAIMSILIGVAAVNYRKTIQLGRDSRRKADLEQIRQALETYRSANSSYPNTGTNAGLTALIPNYITVLPTDPQSGTYAYVAANSGTISTYSLCSSLEIDPAQTLSKCGSASCGSKACNYEKTNP
ncbi:MAG: prepilin-type N-terminal cleavage/methylation domain-containing protein [bacterium]